MIAAIRLVALASVAAALSACAGGGAGAPPRLFSTDWQDDGGKSIAAVHARLKGGRPTVHADLVVAVGAKSDKLVGQGLDGGARWSFAHPIDARPAIAGNVVVGSGGGEVFALDAASGKKLWSRPTGGMPFLGAGDDGALTVVSLGGAKVAGSTLLVVARDGSVKRQIEEPKLALGVPAIVGGVVFVPWSNQYVSAIDVETGDSIGRVTIRKKISRAFTVGGALYFGELGYVRFDDRIGGASRNAASTITVPPRELPGTPRLLAPGTERVPAVANARDKDQLFARPSGPDGPLTIDGGRFYASYYRLVMGFDTPKGDLAWVYLHPKELLGGEAVAGGVALCDPDGKLTILDARGAVGRTLDLGEPIASCVVHADTYRAPAGTGARGLAEQLAEAILSRDATLATAQRLLLRELATEEHESATKTLIDLASDPRTAPVLVKDARAAIAQRRNGKSFMLAALAKHYDFLRDVLRTPPVGPIADALAAMDAQEGAAALSSHLLDPADSDDDVQRSAAALAKLATAKELPALKQFFAMYRGTASADPVIKAVGSVAEALVRLDPKGGRALVEDAAKDGETRAEVRARLEAVLAAHPAGAPPATDAAAPKPAGPPAKPAPAKPAPAKPAPKKK